ncbi:MAG: hypothetical protein WAW86_08215 [Gammaproteobacteria bacterium]
MNITKYILLVSISIFSMSVLADVSVRGYQRNDGSYVQPHYRSNPNNNADDNWSTKGNANPYTGREGNNDRRQGW